MSEPEFEVVAGNVGTVYLGSNGVIAHHVFDDYVAISDSGIGRAGGGPVTLFQRGEPIREHSGKADRGGGGRVSRLTFEIITTDLWSDEGIQEIADEFAAMYGDNFNIASAFLTKAEKIPDPHQDDEEE